MAMRNSIFMDIRVYNAKNRNVISLILNEVIEFFS
jgi:hypothetical protein